MFHPLQKRQNLFIYILLWILIASIHFGVLFFSFKQPFGICIADTLVFNTLLALLLLPVWFVVRFGHYGKSSVLYLLLIHILLSSFLIAIWLVSGLLFLKLVLSSYFIADYFFLSLLWRLISAICYYIIIVLIYYLIVYYDNLQEKIRNETNLKNIVKEAELNLLKNQINPHFLFNSLNSVSSLTMSNPAKAQEVIIKLSEYMRYSLSQGNDTMSTLRKELDNCIRYLEIEKSRFGTKLLYENNIEEKALDCILPAMLLQPLYENAVKHGVYESTEPVLIRTTVRIEKNSLNIHIINGYDPEALPRKGTGTGLTNIRERLKLIYQMDWNMTVEKKENTFEVDIIIPQDN